MYHKWTLHKRKRALLLIFLGWASIGQTHAQEFLVITGQIFESKTKKVLPFASVSIKNEFKGTVANNKGQFSFTFPYSLRKDTLRISYIGFEDLEILIDTIRHELYLELQGNSALLNEVVLTPLEPEYYIKLAVNNMPKKLPKQSLYHSSLL